MTLFTRIINGEIPGRFVWKDELCVAFLTIAPIRPGHTLVVPREEIDSWLDAPPDLTAHLFQTAQHVARGIQAAFPCTKVGLMIAGLEVPHMHIHLTPIDAIRDMDFALQDNKAKAEDLDAAAERIRGALKALGHAQADG
ncbi:MAG TPA: HIT family protein [Verrucomicrobiales bacterium]|nr:HIT family protein [Verrucomicrobiales bacterium]